MTPSPRRARAWALDRAAAWASSDTHATVSRRCWAPSSGRSRSSSRCRRPWTRRPSRRRAPSPSPIPSRWQLPVPPPAFGRASAGVPCDAVVFSQVFFLEFVCTFTLVYCVFATAVDKSGGEQLRRGRAASVQGCLQRCARAWVVHARLQRAPACADVASVTVGASTAAKNAAPLAIGLAIIVGVFAEGPFTGGSMNPARTLGLSCPAPALSSRAALMHWRDASLARAVCLRSQACSAGVGLG